jgi:outer membrane protein OmpA-like peptidoglycan-associated protein
MWRSFFFPLPLFIAFGLTLFSYKIFSQNLVVNGGFERQPVQDGTLPPKPCQFARTAFVVNTCAPGWRTFDTHTPDLLEWDTLAGCPIFPKPRTGRRMIGLIMYHPFQDGQFVFDYHELVQGTLAKPLEKGKTYRISFWAYTNDSLGVHHLTKVFGRGPAQQGKGKQISLGGFRPLFCGNFGFYFSENKIQTREEFMQSQVDFPVRPQVNLEEIVETNGEWLKITLSFKTDRPHKYFLFGNFFSDAATKINMDEEERMQLDVKNEALSFWEKNKRIAYYLFDDFSIVEYNAAAIELSLLNDKKYTFQSALLFDTGKSDLKPEAEAALQQLAEVLQKNPALKVEIGGHTDNVGDDASNQTLSEKRAQSVFNALINRAINANQISWKGYGESSPVAENDSDIGRQKNRRVECRVLE